MITAGIDIGSITTKVAIVEDNEVRGTRIEFTGYNAGEAGRNTFTILRDELGIQRESISRVVATGYGRNLVDCADKAVTEILCHGAGAHYSNPEVRTIIDVGGQDSKALRVNADGKVIDFVMNDKCAAGTGRFLEVMARALQVNLDEMAAIGADAESSASISSTCTVFAESEVISLISKGMERPEIIAGIHESVAQRVSALVGRVGIEEPVMMTGGVARNAGVVRALEAKLGVTIMVKETAQANGAIGAAIIAAKE